MLGTLNGGLEARGIKLPGDAMTADVLGENELRDGLPVLVRITVNYRLRIPAGTRETVDRLLSRHQDKCPTAASLAGAVAVRWNAEITEV
jgi:organic hydroperoxide reductase OsmC/OhrA